MRRFARSLLVLALGVATSAHVGSPDAYFSGRAGPYNIDVVITPPAVVPGLARIVVHTVDTSVTSVNIRPVYWRAGSKGAPVGDEAQRVSGQPGTFAGDLWMMASGSYTIEVAVRGRAGNGSAMVPVAALATGQLALSGSLRVLLIVLGTLLVAGIITAIHVAAGESQVAPGEAVPLERKRHARRAAAIAVPVLAFIVFGGAHWWESEATRYRETLYKPIATRAQVHDSGDVATLELTVTDPAWRAGITPIMPDHGKLAHLFIVGEEFPFAFAHLHPSMPDGATMRTLLPPLPPGPYRVYADVVHESGFQRTLVDSIRLPKWLHTTGSEHLGPDESWSITDRVFVASYMEANPHEGGFYVTWSGGVPVYEKTPGVLRFTLSDIHGNPYLVEPYLGMAGHAVVVRDDGKVFIHLHPNGTGSMASQMAFALRNRGDTTPAGRLRLDDAPAMDGMMTRPDTVRTLSFPYAFPSAGRYRVYVQVRVKGDVHTTAFDVKVLPTGAPPH